jgi:hypothetical protein
MLSLFAEKDEEGDEHETPLLDEYESALLLVLDEHEWSEAKEHGELICDDEDEQEDEDVHELTIVTIWS